MRVIRQRQGERLRKCITHSVGERDRLQSTRVGEREKVE